MATFDTHKNFAYSTIATAPSPATSGTSLIVQAGDGTKFPAVSFNAVIWPISSQPTAANAEIVRVTNISTDTLTITRTQESTAARTVIVGDQIAAAGTAKSLTDIEGLFPVTEANLSTADNTTNDVTSTKHGFAPKSAADATKFLNGAATPVYAQVKDSDLSTSDIATNDASATKHGFLPKLDNTATHFLDMSGVQRALAASDLATGTVVQVVNTTDSAVASGTVVIPSDNTIPQNTEGNQYMSVTITPKTTTNILVIQVCALLGASIVNNIIGSLCQDTTANALAAAKMRVPTANAANMMYLQHVMAAGTTSATTFKFRAGGQSAGTVFFNAESATQLFSTAIKSSIVVFEYVA